MSRVTSWSEEGVLGYFWEMARVPDVDRVALLRQIADVQLERPSDWDMRSIRQAFAGEFRGKWGNTIKIDTRRCWVCGTEEKRIYAHHIIQVQHGGSNMPANLVPLCHVHHRSVHPWLEAPTTWENRRGWTAVSDIAVRAMSKLIPIWEAKQR